MYHFSIVLKGKHKVSRHRLSLEQYEPNVLTFTVGRENSKSNDIRMK